MTTKLTVDEVIKELKLEKKENHNIDTIIKEIRKEYTSSDTVVDLLKYWTKQYETSSVHNLEIDIISDDNRYFKMIKPEDMAFTRNCCLSLKEVDYIKKGGKLVFHLPIFHLEYSQLHNIIPLIELYYRK